MRSSLRLKDIARRRSSASAPVKTRECHGHAQDLFLKQRYSERAAEDRFAVRVDEVDGFPAIAAVQIGMHQIADDGTRADDGHLDGEIIKRGPAA
jgi:hypothetical protein